VDAVAEIAYRAYNHAQMVCLECDGQQVDSEDPKASCAVSSVSCLLCASTTSLTADRRPCLSCRSSLTGCTVLSCRRCLFATQQ